MKYKFYKGQKFGNWEIVDPNREYIQEPSRIKPVILCYDSVYNELRYVRVQCLINRTSKGSKKGNIGWSTRCKFKSLPKYVYKYPLGKKKYRVLYKTPGTNSVKTLFYFNKLEDATNFAQVLH